MAGEGKSQLSPSFPSLHVSFHPRRTGQKRALGWAQGSIAAGGWGEGRGGEAAGSRGALGAVPGGPILSNPSLHSLPTPLRLSQVRVLGLSLPWSCKHRAKDKSWTKSWPMVSPREESEVINERHLQKPLHPGVCISLVFKAMKSLEKTTHQPHLIWKSHLRWQKGEAGL